MYTVKRKFAPIQKDKPRLQLILASTSSYRAALLAKLRLPFVQIDPEYTESAVTGESPTKMCERLARAKAAAVADQEPAAPWLIIGSDQVAHLDGEIFGKPGGFAAAHAQLSKCAGRCVTFETGVALLSSEGHDIVSSERFDIRFRELTADRITRYLNAEEPYDCAGSIKAEGLGITLLAETRGRDVNTLLGLPLMLLQDLLAETGIDPLSNFNY